jgi:hypothetical protein
MTRTTGQETVALPELIDDAIFEMYRATLYGGLDSPDLSDRHQMAEAFQTRANFTGVPESEVRAHDVAIRGSMDRWNEICTARNRGEKTS